MEIERVRQQPPKILTQSQREAYFADGCLLMENAIGADWLGRLQAASAEIIDRSRAIARSDGSYILEDGHSAETPRLRRLTSPVSHHPDFWAFAADSVIGDIVADVVGPDVKFYHSKLNYKWAGGGQAFAWHQDIQAWPHTNYSPVTVGVLLDDCARDQGPLTAIKGSHQGPLHSMYDADGNWVLRIPETELAAYGEQDRLAMTGPAGTVFLLNCRTIHGSARNRSARMRPLLLYVFSAADAFCYVTNPIPSEFEGAIIRGRAARWAHHDPRPCELPPDWSKGYQGPWAYQARTQAASEDGAEGAAARG